MTEKRFKFISDSVAQNLKTPICDNGQPLILGEVLDKMNELSKENEQLKKENKKLNCIIKQLEEKYEDKGFSLAYDMGECE